MNEKELTNYIIVFLHENMRAERVEIDGKKLIRAKARNHAKHIITAGYATLDASIAKRGKTLWFTAFKNLDGSIATIARPSHKELSKKSGYFNNK